MRVNCGPRKAIEQNILLDDSLSCRFLDPVRVELFLAGLSKKQRYIIDGQSESGEFVTILFELSFDENYVDEFPDQGGAEVDDSELEKSLFRFRRDFIGKRLRHSRFAHEGSGDSGAVELLDGHPRSADEQSAAFYGDILLQVPGELDQNLSELGHAVLFRAFFDRNQTGLSQCLEVVDELAGVPYRIELSFVHYLRIWKGTLGDEELENVQPYRSGSGVEDV